MQIDRLFQIVLILLNKKTITAKKLSEHFNVSIRTIYRDIEALSFAGIPIYSLRGKNGGIKLLESYVLDKSLLSSKEQNEILYALESLKSSNYPDVDEVLKKLNLIFNKSSDYWIEVDFSRYGSNDNTLFNNIKKAILNSQAVKFTYFNTNGETSQRTVNPLKIWFKEKAWYLFAYCQKKNEIRQFKINRIKNLTLTNEYFERILSYDKNGKLFEAANLIYEDKNHTTTSLMSELLGEQYNIGMKNILVLGADRATPFGSVLLVKVFDDNSLKIGVLVDIEREGISIKKGWYTFDEIKKFIALYNSNKFSTVNSILLSAGGIITVLAVGFILYKKYRKSL